MILLLDNYDSFAHNLARYVRVLGYEVLVVRNDKISLRDIKQLQPQKIIISPGPKGPAAAGVCMEVVQELGAHVPILGICLGHQVIAAAYGADIIKAPVPVHGKAATIDCQPHKLFAGLPPSFQVARYHSLLVAADTLPAELQVIATTADNLPMAIAHVQYAVYGLQFHPESVLTQYGQEVLANFLSL